jgi:chromate reductase
MTTQHGADRVRVLAVSGSLREASFNRRLLELAVAAVGDHEDLSQVEIEIFDGLGQVDPFSEDVEAIEPPGVSRWRDALDEADAVLISTPEYNSSLPGQLKNALDWASRPRPDQELGGLRSSSMYGKSVAVVSASTGQFGGVWAADELRKTLKAQGARVVDSVKLSVGSAKTAFTENGQLASQDQQLRLQGLVLALVEQVRFVRAAQAGAQSVA